MVRTNRITSFIPLFISLASGILAAFLFLFFYAGSIPSDFSRTRTLLQFLQQDSIRLRTVAVGNSIAMDGFNARLYTTLSCTPNTYNLCSPGQNQLESLLLLDGSPQKPACVLHFFHSIDLGKQDYLNASVIQNFLTFGYVPSPFVKKQFAMTNNAQDLKEFEQSKWALAFHNRWLLPNYVNTYFRQLLRKDLKLAALQTELFHPRNYNDGEFPEFQKQALISQLNKPPNAPFAIDSVKMKLMVQTADYLRQSGCRYVVVFSPINPAISEVYLPYVKGIREFCKNHPSHNITFINLSDVLNATDFVDHLHPNGKGAQKLTQELASRLSQCSSKQ